MEWYRILKDDLFEKTNSKMTGLSSQEAKERYWKDGKNALPKKKTDSLFKIFIRQIMDPIVLLLIVTVVFSFLIHEIVDAIAIIFIIVIDLIMGTIQEWKAEKNAEALANMIQVKTKVLRDGEEILINAEELVVGDIILIESGDKISADLRLLESHNITVNESVLTGESLNVSKNADNIHQTLPLAERKNMLYAGTTVATGRGRALVVAIGLNTEIGTIAHQVNTRKETKSPLTIRMEKFSRQISLLVIVIAILLTLLLMYKNVPGSEIFLAVIALSVSAMPEGLPLALTMALTIASNRMAKKNVIVKKLNSVESLGSCTVIASDKTGTLTVNEQTAKRIKLPFGKEFEITGTGYNDEGTIVGIEESDSAPIAAIVQAGALNNEAKIEQKKGKWEYFGDSIDIAFLFLEKKHSIDFSNIEVLGMIPYESENKYSAVFYRQNNEIHCAVKGSFEKVVSFSDRMNDGTKTTSLDSSLLSHQNEELAQAGYRVIAVADGIVSQFEKKENYTDQDIPSLQFLGLVGFIDPIRKEAKASVAECRDAGIKVVMITGDHPLTAYKIAKELDLVQNMDEVATGIEVDEQFQKGLEHFDAFVRSKKVFTRVTPTNKLEIIESYKRQGEFVAVTGDGVNDTPALRSANIGIAMGSGTDVAKETASMIVVDDNFKSIASGVKEGRNAYSNIRKVSYMLLSCGVAEVLFFVLSILFDMPMPLVAIQLLWLNIVTDGLQDFALSFEKAETTIMKEPPRNPKESIFNKELFGEVATAGITIGLIVFGVWTYLIQVVHMETGLARGYIMALMVFLQNIHVLNCRSEKQSTFKISLKSNWMILFSIASSIVLQFIVMEVPLFSHFLQTESIPLLDLLKLLALSTIILVVMEVYKKRKRNRFAKKGM